MTEKELKNEPQKEAEKTDREDMDQSSGVVDSGEDPKALLVSLKKSLRTLNIRELGKTEVNNVSVIFIDEGFLSSEGILAARTLLG